MPASRILTLFAATIAVALLAGCGEKSPTHTAPPPPPGQPSQQIQQAEIFAKYAGSESCRECHSAQFDSWKGSHHGLAERPVGKGDAAAFSPERTVKHGSQTSAAVEKDGRFFLRTAGLDGKDTDFEAVRVLGHDPLRQFLVAQPGGRWQAPELAWDPHKQEWFDVFGNEDRKPGEWGHWTGRGMNWNAQCASCHNTRLFKNYRPADDTYHTAMAEMSVGCESCHGPMKPHVEWRRKHPASKEPEPGFAKLSRDQMFDTCGSCHSRRREISGDFVPGDKFSAHFQLTTPDETDLYFPDGQVRDELYEFGSFVGSKMHAAGVRCVDCHDPHRAKVVLPGNDLCQKCHGGGAAAPGATVRAPVIEIAAHSFHKTVSCAGCHMPVTTYMQRHPRHDHGFTTPDPLLTKLHGVPNACNRCHTDKDADWALAAANKWWGDKMNRPARERALRIAAARTGGEETGAPLLALLAGETSPYWKAAILRVLSAWTGQPEMTRAFLEHAKHADPLVRTAAVQALEPILSSDPAVRTAITAALDDADRSVRAAAAWALRAGPETKAGRELAETLAHSADQPAGQMQLGLMAQARGDSIQALGHFATAVKWDPNSAGIRHEYAVMLSMNNLTREALQQIREAVKIEPRNADFRYMLGLALNEDRDLRGAVAEFENAVKLAPKHSRAWYNLGIGRSQLGDTAGAIAALKSGEAVAPRDARLPFARATIHARLGQRDEARAAAEAALKAAPDFAEAQQLIEALR